jgi:hypothetical protein
VTSFRHRGRFALRRLAETSPTSIIDACATAPNRAQYTVFPRADLGTGPGGARKRHGSWKPVHSCYGLASRSAEFPDVTGPGELPADTDLVQPAALALVRAKIRGSAEGQSPTSSALRQR